MITPVPASRRVSTFWPVAKREPTPELDRRYGDHDAEPTPWADALELLEEAELFWISTVCADGRPHVTPLPAVWQDDALHFCTGADAFVNEGLTALVFAVRPTKIIAFAKGGFAQTRYRF